MSADEAPPRGMGRGDGLRGGEERVGISSVMTSWGCSDMPYARKIMCVPYRERVYRHTEMIYSMCVLMCVTHRGRVCSMLVAGQVLSLLLVTTGGTSALLVGRGLEAPTFVALCTYIMLSLFYGGSLLFSARYVGWEIFVYVLYCIRLPECSYSVCIHMHTYRQHRGVLSLWASPENAPQVENSVSFLLTLLYEWTIVLTSENYKLQTYMHLP